MQPAPAALACNGQPGKIAPGFSAVTLVTSAAIGGLIGTIASGPAAAMAAALLAMATYDLENICSQPQPAPVTMDPQDWIDAFDFELPSVQLPAAMKLTQWFINWMWPTWCVCADNSVPPPATPTPLPPASGNPGLPVGPVPPFCKQGRQYTALSSPGLNEFVGFTSNGVGAPTPPSGWTSVEQKGQIKYGGAPGTTVAIDFNRYINFGSQVYRTVQLGELTANPFFDFTMPVDPSVTAVSFTVRPSNTSLSVTVDSSNCLAYCGPTNGPAPLQPCCPPDPALEQELNQILGLVQAIWNKITQAASSSWTDGVRHAGLAGAGSFALAGHAVGVRVEVTKLPDTPQILPGDPTFYWNMGFITPLAMESPLKGNRLVFASQSFQLPAVTDGIAYTLLDNTIVDLVELLPV